MPQEGKYKVLEELGSGGMGTVFKGLLIGQAGFQRPIVIKKLRDEHDPGHVQLFVDEARRYAVLDHENIGRIFDFERVAGERSIILEYIDGWSLVEYLERHKDLKRLPDVELSVFIVSRVCRALQYVFEKAAIVHRDVSPSNIMMTREGTVKLIDFGIATRSGTRDSSLSGKPAYMAPEMVVELRADNRSDLFSLGAVFFEMLTGERLFSGETTAQVLEQVIAGQNPSPRTFNPDIPDGVMAILRRALQRDATRRYSNAGEMGEACEHVLYDKGYGPTNLTLKQHLHQLFPGSVVSTTAETAGFPVIEPTLIPITDGGRRRKPTPGEKTPVAAPRVYRTSGSRPAATPDVPPFEPTPPPGTTLPPNVTSAHTIRRTKSRIRPR
jgi:eukaryotic-like serine/threonine-protein kinase